jgi:hypothetical protein
MAMRILITFARPLAKAVRLRTTISLGALAGCSRVRFRRGDREAELFGEGLAKARVEAALAEAGTAWERIDTSLAPEEDRRLDEVGDGQERVKPPGR